MVRMVNWQNIGLKIINEHTHTHKSTLTTLKLAPHEKHFPRWDWNLQNLNQQQARYYCYSLGLYVFWGCMAHV